MRGLYPNRSDYSQAPECVTSALPERIRKTDSTIRQAENGRATRRSAIADIVMGFKSASPPKQNDIRQFIGPFHQNKLDGTRV
jgi:hypothetical protein